jgi:hypothetical protein
MMEHLTLECLLAAAAGDKKQRRVVAAHATDCAQCRDELARVLGLAEGAPDELIASRPGCPAPEQLAGIPAGGEWDDPHVADCPLCRQELDLIRSLQAKELTSQAWDGPLLRTHPLVTQTSTYIQDGPGESIRLELKPGAECQGKLAGALVKLSVDRQTIVIEIKGPAEQLEAELQGPLLVRRLQLDQERTEIPLESWQVLIVRLTGGDK